MRRYRISNPSKKLIDGDKNYCDRNTSKSFSLISVLWTAYFTYDSSDFISFRQLFTIHKQVPHKNYIYMGDRGKTIHLTQIIVQFSIYLSDITIISTGGNIQILRSTN